MDFTTTGEKLASVGQAPDFMLTVWDWVNEKVILHCKAFGQDVAKVNDTPVFFYLNSSVYRGLQEYVSLVGYWAHLLQLKKNVPGNLRMGGPWGRV